MTRWTVLTIAIAAVTLVILFVVFRRARPGEQDESAGLPHDLSSPPPDVEFRDRGERFRP